MRYELETGSVAIRFEAAAPMAAEKIADRVSIAVDRNGAIQTIWVDNPPWVAVFDGTGDASKSSGAAPSYDEEVDVLTFDFGGAQYSASEEASMPGIVVDYDVNGDVRGLEIFDASKRISRTELETIAKAPVAATRVQSRRAAG